MKEMKTVCFQAKQIGGTVQRIDVNFHIVPTSCTSQLSLGVNYSSFLSYLLKLSIFVLKL